MCASVSLFTLSVFFCYESRAARMVTVPCVPYSVQVEKNISLNEGGCRGVTS